MTRQTKATKFARIAQMTRTIREGRKPMPKMRADGSVGTKPTVPCPDLPESEVMALVLSWLESHGCVVDRMNNGAGYLNGREEYGTYGIIGGGDFVGMLPDGRHLEIECKKGKGGSLSKEQQKRMRRVRRANGVYEVIHGVPELEYKIFPLTTGHQRGMIDCLGDRK